MSGRNWTHCEQCGSGTHGRLRLHSCDPVTYIRHHGRGNDLLRRVGEAFVVAIDAERVTPVSAPGRFFDASRRIDDATSGGTAHAESVATAIIAALGTLADVSPSGDTAVFCLGGARVA